MKDTIAQLLRAALDKLTADGLLPPDTAPEIQVERTRDPAHGDLASNLALSLAGRAGMKPRDLAARLQAALPPSAAVARTEIAGPGFLNFFLDRSASTAVVAEVLQAGDRYGCSDEGAGRRVQVEFVSANPTGPLHVGHGRGAAVGDSLLRLLRATGWDAASEFYYNDAGQQIENLARSVQARCRGLAPGDPDWPADGYRGDYIAELAQAFLRGDNAAARDRQAAASGDPEDLAAVRAFAVAYLRHEQDLDLKAFGVAFDVYFLESSLYESGEVEAVVRLLVDGGKTYERDGALWLRTTAYGDDKDRVMRKADGSYTYFLPDVAYHLNKWRRGFRRVINEQGADHHSTVTRVRAGLQALEQGIPAGWPDYLLHQMVTVFRDGAEVKLSKRAGSYLTLRDLIDEVGRDATRYFLVARAPTSQLTFDIDLALSRSNDNPVYYIQYAHARVCSVHRRLAEAGLPWNRKAALERLPALDNDEEQELLRCLARYPETVARAARDAEPHAVANYLREIAGLFHGFYNAHKVIVEDEALRDARVALAEAVRQVIANGLGLLGVGAPERM